MGVIEGIIAIVLIGTVTDLMKKALKRRGATNALKRELMSKEQLIQQLTDETKRLTKDNKSLRIALEEEQILANEAVSTFGSRLDRLKQSERSQESVNPQHVHTSE